MEILPFVMMRESVSKGYPQGKKELEATISKLLGKSNKKNSSDIVGLIVPHGSFKSSGAISAKAYKFLNCDYDTIVIMGPDHATVGNRVAVSLEDWETPLGSVTVNKDVADIICKEGHIAVDELAHMYEHSIETQLPFLQTKMAGFNFVPISISPDLPLHTYEEIAKSILKGLEGKKALIIATTELTRVGKKYDFLPKEAKGKEEKWVKTQDKELLDAIMSKNANEFLEKATEHQICGTGPVTVFLHLMKTLNADGNVVEYQATYKGKEHKNSYIGYASVLFETGNAKEPAKTKKLTTFRKSGKAKQ